MATFNFVIQPNGAQLADAQALLNPRGYKVAMQAAISRTLTSGKSATSRIVRSSLLAQKDDVDKTIKVAKPSFEKLEGEIRVNRKPLKLAYFKSTQTKRGSRVKVWKGRPPQLLPSTFKATMKSGHVGVYERQRQGANRSPRLPIDERFGPNVVTAIEGNRRQPGVQEDITVNLSETFGKNVESQINRLLNNPKSAAKFGV